MEMEKEYKTKDEAIEAIYYGSDFPRPEGHTVKVTPNLDGTWTAKLFPTKKDN